MPWKSPEHRRTALEAWQKAEENQELKCNFWFANSRAYPQRTSGCALGVLIQHSVSHQEPPEHCLFPGRTPEREGWNAWTTYVVLEEQWGLTPDEGSEIMRRFDTTGYIMKRNAAFFEALARLGDGEEQGCTTSN